MGMGLRVRDQYVKDTRVAALPEAVTFGVATFGSDRGRGVPGLLEILLVSLLLMLLQALLLGVSRCVMGLLG